MTAACAVEIFIPTVRVEIFSPSTQEASAHTAVHAHLEVSGFLTKGPVHWCYAGSSQSFRQRVKQKLNAFPGLFLCCCKGGGEGRNNKSVRVLGLALFSELLDHTPVGASPASGLQPSDMLFCFLSAGIRRQGLEREGRRKGMIQSPALKRTPTPCSVILK